MQTVRGRRSTGSQSYPHIRAFGLRTIRRTYVHKALSLQVYNTPQKVCRQSSSSHWKSGQNILGQKIEKETEIKKIH